MTSNSIWEEYMREAKMIMFLPKRSVWNMCLEATWRTCKMAGREVSYSPGKEDVSGISSLSNSLVIILMMFYQHWVVYDLFASLIPVSLFTLLQREVESCPVKKGSFLFSLMYTICWAAVSNKHKLQICKSFHWFFVLNIYCDCIVESVLNVCERACWIHWIRPICYTLWSTNSSVMKFYLC